MVNGWFLAMGTFLGLVGLLALRRGIRTARLLATVRTLAEAALSSLAAGLVRTRGNIVVSTPLRASLTGRPAAYFYVRFESIDERGRRRQLATIKQWTQSSIESEGARVTLEPWTPAIASPHRHVTDFGTMKTVPAEHVELFEEAGIADRHVARLGKIVATEYRIEPGDAMHVLGTYEPAKGIYRAGRNPYFVSATPDPGPVERIRNELALWVAVPPMILAAAALVLVLAFA